jgi:hypothetical protein
MCLALGWASLGSSSLRFDAPAPALLAPVEPLGFSSVFSPHKQKSPSLRWGFFVCLAEREGFETFAALSLCWPTNAYLLILLDFHNKPR